MAGWTAFWRTYRACLSQQLIDVTVPEHLPDLLAATTAFENIIVRDGNIPVGFWPQGGIQIYLYCSWQSPDHLCPRRPTSALRWTVAVDGLRTLASRFTPFVSLQWFAPING